MLRDAGESMRALASLNKEAPLVHAHVQESLLQQIQIPYAATVRATVNREGEWANLSYSYQIGYGARRIAVLSLAKAVEEFIGHCKIMIATPRYSESVELITQIQRVLTDSFEELLRKVQLMGKTVFKDNALKNDPTFWQKCMAEWGQGPGYKTRVADHNRKWFADEARNQLEEQLKMLIEREWSCVLDNITELLEEPDS